MMPCITNEVHGSILKAPKREHGRCCVVLVGTLKRPKFGFLLEWPAIRLIAIIPLVFDVLPIVRHIEILFPQ